MSTTEKLFNLFSKMVTSVGEKTPSNDQKVPTWYENLDHLVEALKKIQLKDFGDLSFEKLYRMTYEIVRERKYRELYDAINQIIHKHAQSVQSSILRSLEDERLNKLIETWNEYLLCTNMFKDVLMFLDQAYSKKQNIDSIYQLNLNAFLFEVIHSNQVHDILQNILLGMILADRNDEAIDITNFKGVITVLLTLNKTREEYEELFEKPFLVQSKIFYKKQAQELLAYPSTNTINYIDNYVKRYDEEKDRVKRLLHESTQSKILSVVDECLVIEQIERIIELKNGLAFLLQTNQIQYIKHIQQFYKKSNRESQFFDAVLQIFNDMGLKIVERENISPKDYSQVVNQIVELKESFKKYEEHCFEGNDSFLKQIEADFVVIFNQNPRMAEFLAAHLNETLRSKRELSEEEQEEVIEKFMKLFKLFYDKDIFERFYKQYLGKRLLHTRPNLDIERKVVSKLKLECGNTYTSDFEQMITDMEITSNHMDLFDAEVINTNQSVEGIEFKCNVLQSRLWAIPSFPESILPAAPSRVFDMFKAFYLRHHEGRKLQIHPNHGCAMIKMLLKSKNGKNDRNIFIDVSTLQMIILMLFNDNKKLSLQQILDKTNIPENNVKNALNPIVLGKAHHRILKRVGEFPPKTLLSITDEIEINNNFSSKNHKFKVPFNATQIEDDADLRASIINRTDKERGYEIDCAIVRALKELNVMKHQDLIVRVINLLKHRFKPDVKAINARIHRLIEKDYMARRENDPNTYVYVA